MTNEMKSFFQHLGSFNKENDLSDIIYFGCISSHLFKQLFLKHVFPDIDINNITNIDDIEREVWSEDKSCRVDFKFIVNDEIYLVENKIYDLDDHYEFYPEKFTKEPRINNCRNIILSVLYCFYGNRIGNQEEIRTVGKTA